LQITLQEPYSEVTRMAAEPGAANGVGEEEEERYVRDGGITIGDIYIPPAPAPAMSFEANGPRLVITHIENENFKSYAGLQVLGPFHKSFTSIVGPNGSGKSNVIDSMLFVFGFRAQKTRAAKLSSMIHSSSTFPNVQSAKVAVHFQEIIDRGEDFDVVADSQFCVSRTVHKDKDSSSFYQIGTKRCKTKDVTRLLMEKGIDLDHNRFLILQGEVEQIALMKPKGLTESDGGMLEFLEDIIGTSRFKEPIEKLNANVEELSELRTEKLNRVKLVEKEKDELEGPMKEALGYIKLENQKVEVTHKQRQRYILDSETNIEKAVKRKEEIEASVSDLNDKQKEIVGRKKEKQEEIKAKGKDYDKLTEELDEQKAQFDKMEKEDTGHREDMKSANVKRKKIKQEAEVEKGKREKLEGLPEENAKKIAECEEHRDTWEQKVEEKEAEYEAAMASLKMDTQQWQDEKAKHQTKLVDLKKAVNEAAEELNLAQNEHDVYVSEERKAKDRLEEMKNTIVNKKEAVKDKSKTLEELTKKIPEKSRDLRSSEEEAEKLNGSFAQGRQRLSAMRTEYQEKKSSQSQAKSSGQVVDALMAQKRNGNIPGIIGRLGDLGAIDKKFDCAISTAVSGLDVMLVDSTATGTQCIEFLRRSGVGRGNFFALEKAAARQDYVRAMQPQQFPQGVPRLFDLVTPAEDRFRPAFYHYMKDTLVATDMQQARTVAFGAQRFRVVDLEGNVIETSGTMSGGGGRKSSGKMGSQVARAVEVDPRELQTMERGIGEVQEEVDGLQRRKTQLEDKIHTLKTSLRDEEKTQRKLAVEVNPLEAMVKDLEAGLPAQEKLVKDAAPDKKRVAAMTKRIEAAQAVHEDAAAKADVVQKEVKSCDAKIKEVTSGKIKAIEKKRNEAVKKLDQFKNEITKLNVEIKGNERNLKKVNDKIENMEAEIKECEESMLKMKARREEIEAIGSELLANTEEKKKENEELKSAIAGFKKELDAVEKEEMELKSSRIEVDNELKKWDDSVKDNTKKLAFWKKELRKLSLQEVPGEEAAALEELSREAVLELDLEQLSLEVNAIETQIAASKPNMAAIEEYNRKQKVYLERVGELDLITKDRDLQKKHYDDCKKQRFNDFMDGFGIITGKLKEMYQMITLGGDAELELVDSLDPFSEGIVFSVRPPKKSWKNISNLSGGEKTLSSLALVFALHYYKPTPLYVMDEIDAALDFKNVSIVANYVKERTKNAQFIIISLRSNMFELADRLVGIYKTHDATKSVTINPGLVEALPPAPRMVAVSPGKVAPGKDAFDKVCRVVDHWWCCSCIDVH